MISKKIIYFLLVFILSIPIFSQDKFTVSGTISNKNSNETLIGVNVSVSGIKTGVTTNEYGFYSLTLPKGGYEIIFSYVGFAT